MGAYLTLGDLGSGLGPILAYLIIDLWGVRWAYVLGAVVFGLALLLLSIALRRQQVSLEGK